MTDLVLQKYTLQTREMNFAPKNLTTSANLQDFDTELPGRTTHKLNLRASKFKYIYRAQKSC